MRREAGAAECVLWPGPMEGFGGRRARAGRVRDVRVLETILKFGIQNLSRGWIYGTSPALSSMHGPAIDLNHAR
jgi:hypothetical protein